jgi:leader peptidase (prepilin peptidase)/N-methyltransferase
MVLLSSGVVFIVGIVIGSFLNVVIFRLPQIMANNSLSLTQPARSFCPRCQHTLGVLELLPIVSFLWQKARCKHCASPISWQYPLVELATGLLSVAIFWQFGLQVETLYYLLALYFLISLWMIDVQLQLLPDSLTLPLLWLGLVFQIHLGDLYSGVVGAMVGYLSLWIVYWGFKLTTGREGMGYGDFKLNAAIGAWLGWQAMPNVFLLSALSGLIFFTVKRNFKSHIAFGPFLIIAFVLLAGDVPNLLLKGDFINQISAGINDIVQSFTNNRNG